MGVAGLQLSFIYKSRWWFTSSCFTCIFFKSITWMPVHPQQQHIS